MKMNSSMITELTAAAERALTAAAQWTFPTALAREGDPAQTAWRLLAGLLAEPETRAAQILARHGVTLDRLRAHCPGLVRRDETSTQAGAPRFLPRTILAEARARTRHLPEPMELATEHLLLGLVGLPDAREVADWLQKQGLAEASLAAEIDRLHGISTEPLEADPAAPLIADADSAETARIWRLLDAAANRAREGLRVLEDYARFVLDDRRAVQQLKELRHQLSGLLAQLPADQLLAHRDTATDVGATVSTPAEFHRSDALAVVTANGKRLEEALRSLEEYGKLFRADWAAEVEQLRYHSYHCEQTLWRTAEVGHRLADVQLYVLIDGGESPPALERLVRALAEGGVQAIQLRDKRLADRELVARARLLRQWTRELDLLLVINDRPDVALLSAADGVHVGQTELAVADARRVLGAGRLVGVSTHSLPEARQAVAEGADYIGVGPTFPSRTKSFAKFTGVELLSAVAAEIPVPAFAIGGIDAARVPQVLAAGLRRIAVSSALTEAADPATAAAELRRLLTNETNS